MYLSSWSGGKDSCLAYYRALQSGYKIASLVNFISREYQRVRFHGIDRKLIHVQSELLGIPLCQQETSPDNYEPAFKDAVKSFKPQGIKGMVFGDIYVNEHKEWVERVCSELGIEAVEPLWKQNTENLLTEFIDNGFQAVIVSANAELIEKNWVGKTVDRYFIRYLKTKTDLDICGERGEYHTFVTSGPVFNGRIEITDKDVIKKDGYWLLDIKDYKVMR
ncbi:MAG: diphthine--ammonia ligase [Nitrospiraceae bacterium]|nr:diphthine--ammonia ligase [Nitrospiraceae bacterium]